MSLKHYPINYTPAHNKGVKAEAREMAGEHTLYDRAQGFVPTTTSSPNYHWKKHLSIITVCGS